MDKNVWCIRAGKKKELEDIFINKELIALSWGKTGNLCSLKSSKTDIYNKLKEFYPNIVVGAGRVFASQLYRFIFEVEINDFIIFVSLKNNLIYIGKICSQYEYNTSLPHDSFHSRKVSWIKTIGRSSLMKESLRAIGAPSAFFKVVNYYEFLY